MTGEFFDPNGPGAALQNFGFATMAASQQPGVTLGGALGQGYQGMNQAALQRAQTNLYGAEGAGKNLNNALTLRQINIGNQMRGLPPIAMNGVPNLTPQQPPSSAGYTWGTPTGSSPSQGTREEISPENDATMKALYPDQPTQQAAPQQNGGAYGYTQGAQEVALGYRPPANLDEATQAASLLQFTGMNPERQKQLEGMVAKNQEPQNLREGNTVYYPLGGKQVSASKNVSGLNSKNQPVVTSYMPSISINGTPSGRGAGNRNLGAGAASASGEIRTGFSPEEDSAQKNYFGAETQSYGAAVKSLQNLQLMQHSIDTLNSDTNFLNTGKWGEQRVAIAKSLQGAGITAFDPDKIASAESLLKTTGRLGFDMSKQLGAREPGVITQQAIKLNPGIENTPQGIQLLKDSVSEEAQRVIDEHNFKGQFYSKNGYSQQKAETAFDAQFKPELYAKRAVSQTQPIKVNNPAGVKGLLAGTKIITPKGLKIIPPGVGITPPSYQDMQQPEIPAQPVELEGAEEGQ